MLEGTEAGRGRMQCDDGKWKQRVMVVAVAVALAPLNLHSKATELQCHYCITSIRISYTISGSVCTSACWSNKRIRNE